MYGVREYSNFILLYVAADRKLLGLIRSPVAFCFYFHYFRVKKDLAVIYVKEAFSCVFP